MIRGVPGVVVQRVQDEQAGGGGAGHVDQLRGPPRGRLRGGRVGGPQVVDLVAEGHREHVVAGRHLPGEAVDVRGDPLSHGRVGEETAAVPGEHPGGQEVEARQVPLQQVDGDGQVELGGHVDEGEQVIDAPLADQRAVGLDPAFKKQHPGVEVKWLDQPGDRYSVIVFAVLQRFFFKGVEEGAIKG
jgi:hypothetical protein